MSTTYRYILRDHPEQTNTYTHTNKQADMQSAKESTRPTVNQDDLKRFEDFTRDFGMEG